MLKGDRSDSTFTRVRVAASNLPVTAQLQSSSDSVYKLDPDARLVVRGQVDSLEPVETVWTVFRKFSDGAEDEETSGPFEEQRSINEVSLVVAPGGLPATRTSVRYTFRLTASAAGLVSSAEMTVLVNSAPFGGTLRVRPEQGYAFDMFELASAESSWTDDAEDFPLACRFGYMHPRGQGMAYLTDTALAFASPLVMLPVGEAPGFNFSVFVETSDVWGSSGLATARVRIGDGNATLDDGVAALVRTEGVGGSYAVHHIIDALAAQSPPQATVDQMARALRGQIEAEAITAASASRVVSTAALVARSELSSASIDDCIAVVEQLAACTRRDGAGLQPCRLSHQDIMSIAGAATNLFNAAHSDYYQGVGGVRRLADGTGPPEQAEGRVDALLDMMQVLAEATLQPLVPGESAELSAGAFTMQVHRRQEFDYLGRDIKSANHRVLSVPGVAWALPDSGVRTVGALVTVWAGDLPFFWDTESAQPACLSKLTDQVVGNTTRWARRGVYKTVSRLFRNAGSPLTD